MPAAVEGGVKCRKRTTSNSRATNAKRRSPSRSPVAARRATPSQCPPAGGYLDSPYTPVGALCEALPVVFQLTKAACLLGVLGLLFGYAALIVEPAASSWWATARGVATRMQLAWWHVVAILALGLLLGAYRLDAAAKRHAAQAQRSGAPGGWGQRRNVVIVGAGPSGLVAAKFLREAGHSVRIFEAEDDIGGTFRYRAYDHAIHVSSKYLTAFTDLRLGPKEEDHLPITRYLEYLDEYAQMFDLRSLMEFGMRVADVTRRSPELRARGKAEYIVTVCKNGSQKHAATELVDADAVVVCSGLHLYPLRQHIDGIETFSGELIHSIDYKHRSQLRNKNVLISGSGETAMDIAYHGICPGGDEANSVVMSTKNGFLSTPSCLPGGLPLDIFITNLFECCYEHRWVETFHLKWKAATYGIRGAFWLFTGSSRGYNQWAGSKAEVKRGYHFINKSGRAMSAINQATKGSIRSFPWNLSQPKVHRPIRLVGQVLSHEGNGSFHTDCGQIITDVDMVVQATGYRQTFPFLSGRPLDERGDHPLPKERLIVDPDEPHLCFLGFARPNVGAIPPIAEMQIMWWLQYVQGEVALPLRSPSYRLLSSSSKKVSSYGVDQYDDALLALLIPTIHSVVLLLIPTIHSVVLLLRLYRLSWIWPVELLTPVYPYGCDVGVGVRSGAYMHCLARDIGAAPSVSSLAKKVGWKAMVAYTMGQAFTPFFRIVGPFADTHSAHVASTELFDTVTRRGLGSNLMFGIICATFGVLNLFCLVVDLLCFAVGFHAVPLRSGHLF